MHTDSNRAHFSRDVTSLLGSVSFIMFIGQNNKGFAILMLIIYIFLWGQVIKLYRFYLFLQVWFATDSGNLEVTYSHNEEHVCFSLSPNLVFLFYSCSILTCDLESGCNIFSIDIQVFDTLSL